jgi:ribokinase
MKAARRKGVETILNPAPAISLPEEAYQGLDHLMVNETEAATLSGIQNPTDWNEVAAVFISRGVRNVIITLGGEVQLLVLVHNCVADHD